MTRPLNVQFFHTRRSHFGAHSGVHQFISHLDTSKVLPFVRSVSDSDDDMPAHGLRKRPAVRRAIRELVQCRGQIWYKLSDLQAEGDAFGRWARGGLDVLHFIDAEHTAQFLPWLASSFRSRGGTVGTYHQPARILASVVPASVPRHLDRVVLVSSSQRAFFEGHTPPERLCVVPHGVDVDFFRPRPDAPRAHDGVRCLTTGSYFRDWALLARVANGLRHADNMTFDVVSSSAPVFPALPSVTVHRQIDDEALRRLYQEADLLLLPLVDATANNALLEGMASGLPVVATDLVAVREYAAPLGGVYVPHDADAFIAAIASLASKPEARQRMGVSSRQRAETFAWPLIARMYEQLYAQIALERGR